MKYYYLQSNFINPISDLKADTLLNGVMIFTVNNLDGESKIIYFGEENSKSQKLINKKGITIQILDYRDNLIIPGLWDMHFHWVQDDVCLKPKTNLLNWLSRYTWPYESKFKNPDFSNKKAKFFAKKLIRNGTVGGAVYSSIHSHTVDHALKEFSGNFIIGNVLMTMNSPKYLSQTHNEAISIVKKLSKKYKEKYAVTPRFAITTDHNTMTESAKIAKINNSYIQTHLSETENECNVVLDIFKNIPKFKNVKSYTEVYDKCNIINSKTILGHGIYLNDSELKLIAKKKSLIAHCPTSNAPIRQSGLGSGLFDYKRAERLKVNWALASDIGGGPYLSMFDVMKSFVNQNLKIGNKKATYTKALNRSTNVPTQFLKLKKCGNFTVGNQATFLILNKTKISKSDNAEAILKRKIENSSRKNSEQLIQYTFINGKLS